MTDNLRRSSRRNKKRSYSIGDIVDIVEVSRPAGTLVTACCRMPPQGASEACRRSHLHPVISYSHFYLFYQNGKGSVKGLLLSKLSDSSTGPTASAGGGRWLVALDDAAESSSSSWAAEDELQERVFGEILGKLSTEELAKARNASKTKKGVVNGTRMHVTSSAGAGTVGNHSSKSKEAATATASAGTSSNGSVAHKNGVGGNHRKNESNPTAKTQASSQDASGDNKKRKTRASSPNNSPSNNNNNNKEKDMNHHSDASSPSSDISKKAARASAREERSRRRQALMEDDLNGYIHHQPGLVGGGVITKSKNGRPNKKKKPNPRTGDDVVQVPMLTGILYLYRGIPRRAEFVRKV